MVAAKVLIGLSFTEERDPWGKVLEEDIEMVCAHWVEYQPMDVDIAVPAIARRFGDRVAGFPARFSKRNYMLRLPDRVRGSTFRCASRCGALNLRGG